MLWKIWKLKIIKVETLSFILQQKSLKSIQKRKSTTQLKFVGFWTLSTTNTKMAEHVRNVQRSLYYECRLRNCRKVQKCCKLQMYRNLSFLDGFQWFWLQNEAESFYFDYFQLFRFFMTPHCYIFAKINDPLLWIVYFYKVAPKTTYFTYKT